MFRLEFEAEGFQDRDAGGAGAEIPVGMKEGDAPHSSAWRKPLARETSRDGADRVTRPPIEGSPSEAPQVAS